MKNVVKLQTFYFPWELEQAIEGFVTYYNNARYREFTENACGNGWSAWMSGRLHRPRLFQTLLNMSGLD